MNTELLSWLMFIVICVSAFSFLVWIGFVFYLKLKWLPQVEDILEDGRRYFSLNLLLAGQGCLHYAPVFFNDWYAKRINLLEKREQVPKKARRLFTFGFYLFMLNNVMFWGAGAIIYFFKL